MRFEKQERYTDMIRQLQMALCNAETVIVAVGTELTKNYVNQAMKMTVCGELLRLLAGKDCFLLTAVDAGTFWELGVSEERLLDMGKTGEQQRYWDFLSLRKGKRTLFLEVGTETLEEARPFLPTKEENFRHARITEHTGLTKPGAVTVVGNLRQILGDVGNFRAEVPIVRPGNVSLK